MFGIRKTFRRLFGRSATKAFNAIVSYLDNFCADESIDFHRPDSPSAENPPCIGVSEEWLAGKCMPKVSSTGVLYSNGGTISTKSIGTTQGTVAAGDHSHSTTDISDWDTATSDFLSTSDIGVTVAAADHTHEGVGGSVPEGVLTQDDIGDTVQAHSDALDALEAELDANGKVPLSQLTGNIQGHSGDCLVTIDDDGVIGHSGNDAYDVLAELVDKSTITNHAVTLPFPSWATGATKASVIVGTDADGDLKNVATLPASSNATWDRMLVVAAGGTSLSWKNVRAENPSSILQLVAGGSTSTSTQGASHTVADTGSNAGNGFVLPVVTRVIWTGTLLRYFYTTLTFDKYGRLYSLSGETAVTIDSPVKVTWN